MIFPGPEHVHRPPKGFETLIVEKAFQRIRVVDGFRTVVNFNGDLIDACQNAVRSIIKKIVFRSFAIHF